MVSDDEGMWVRDEDAEEGTESGYGEFRPQPGR